VIGAVSNGSILLVCTGRW